MIATWMWLTMLILAGTGGTLAHGLAHCPGHVQVLQETPGQPMSTVPLDGGPTFTMSLFDYDAATGATESVNSALTGWLFFNATASEEIENFSVTNGAQYTYSNFSSIDLTDISTVVVGGGDASGLANATAQLVDYGNLSQQSTVTVSLNFSALTLPTGPSPPPPGSSQGSSLPFALFLQLAGVALFALVVFVGVRGWSKLLRPLTGE